jgi:HD-like signal output (HDOD) protein
MFKLFDGKKTDTRKELAKVLGGYDLPSFPAISQQILKLIRDPNVSSTEVVDILSRDPGLSVRVLQTVNSAAFGLRQRVKNLNQAVVLMGMSSLESLVLSFVVAETLPRPKAAGFDPVRFWRTSARRAAAARALAGTLHAETQIECYTAGLLLDMAVPFLMEQMPDEYGPILERWNDQGGNLATLDRTVFPWDHAEVATWLGKEWKLPDSLVAAISGHHGTAVSGEICPPAIRLVGYIRENPENDGTDELIELGRNQYGMDEERLFFVLENSLKLADEIAEFFI